MRKNKKRTIEDLREIARKAIGEAEEVQESVLLKAIRKEMSEAYGRRGSTVEIRGVLQKLIDGKVIVMTKPLLKINKWSEAKEVTTYKVFPERIAQFGQVIGENPEPEEEEKPTEIKFIIKVDTNVKMNPELMKQVSEFEGFSVIEFSVQKTPEFLKKLLELFLEFRNKKVNFEFTRTTDPRIPAIINSVSEQ